MMEDEGFESIKVLPPSSRRQATVPRTVAFESFESHAQSKRKKPIRIDELFLLAEDEGFEPPRTESESGVLPLHKSSMCRTRLLYPSFWKSQGKFQKISKIFSLLHEEGERIIWGVGYSARG